MPSRGWLKKRLMIPLFKSLLSLFFIFKINQKMALAGRLQSLLSPLGLFCSAPIRTHKHTFTFTTGQNKASFSRKDHRRCMMNTEQNMLICFRVMSLPVDDITSDAIQDTHPGIDFKPDRRQANSSCWLPVWSIHLQHVSMLASVNLSEFRNKTQTVLLRLQSRHIIRSELCSLLQILHSV